jgi:hypothetical protein
LVVQTTNASTGPDSDNTRNGRPEQEATEYRATIRHKRQRIPDVRFIPTGWVWWDNGIAAIMKSAKGGLGVFAAQDLKPGQVILTEEALVRFPANNPHNAVQELSKESKGMYYDLTQGPWGSPGVLTTDVQIAYTNA